MRRPRRLPALCALLAAGACPAFDIPLDGWTASIDPATLAITARRGAEGDIVIAGESPYHLAQVEQRAGEVVASLADSGIEVRFAKRGARLSVRFDSAGDARLDWPMTGAAAALSALILPEGEGLYLPSGDADWIRRFDGECLGLGAPLSMPFWSYALRGHTLTYHVSPEPRSELCFGTQAGRLTARLSREFRALDGDVPLEVDIGFGDASPIAPALEYRARLVAAGTFETLAAKARRNADVAKLAGAVHFYVWGDGRTPAFVHDLESLGLHAAWIGYDQDEHAKQVLVGRDTVQAARAAGFLIGPYDSFGNAQDPDTGDQASRWPGDLWPAGCIVTSRGAPKTGFADRGCELSSEALARAELTPLQPLAARMDRSLRDGANSYFIDVDAFGELYDDYSAAHPMTVFEDRANRIARLAQARARGVVLGSEQGVGWSVPLIDFAHGAASVHNAALWSEKKSFGRWWPPDRPGVFFKEVEPGPEFVAAKYDAAFRLPLYEAAFHDAVVATDRWDTPMNKFPGLAPRRQLLEMLYGIPSIWAADRTTLAEWRVSLRALVDAFEPLHRHIAMQPLTSFEWLTPDRLVQRTRFGTSLILTANFRTTAVESLGPGCLRVEGLPGKSAATFCPVQAPKPRAGAGGSPTRLHSSAHFW
jgi:hypothetical protein